MMTIQIQCGCGCESLFSLCCSAETGSPELAPSWYKPTPFRKEEKEKIRQHLSDWRLRGGKIDRVVVKFV